MRLRHARRALLVAVVALLGTLASSRVQRERLVVQDWDCPPAPASCARPMRVGGFPFPYLEDFHGLSVVGSVDLMGALMGEDRFHPGPFLLDLACWGAVASVGLALGSRRRAGTAS